MNRDLRLIVHQTGASLMFCYVDHHDPAYCWAERRKIERHLKAGATQIVEVRETVREIEIPRYVEAPEATEPDPGPLFDRLAENDLPAYGVPSEWLDDVRHATEDSLFDLAEHLPGEAAEDKLANAGISDSGEKAECSRRKRSSS